MRNFRKMPFSEIAATAPPERVVLFYTQITGGDAHLNTKSTASCGCGKPRTTPISPEEKRWLREQLYQSHYDECMQERREAYPPQGQAHTFVRNVLMFYATHIPSFQRYFRILTQLFHLF